MTDLNGAELWQYPGRFAEAFPIYSDDGELRYGIAHYTSGDGVESRFLVLDADFRTVYQDHRISTDVTTVTRGVAAVCQLAKSDASK